MLHRRVSLMERTRLAETAGLVGSVVLFVSFLGWQFYSASELDARQQARRRPHWKGARSPAPGERA